ncbi:lysylphosphatidylglycerol synthase domain-containing protein [Nocardioides sp.]|uniref:lysylphosphatidylglycerol synthase domain-containing protein n=1 Tax=Nocardioides sp. TaxID=35761 RepID=UPI002614DF22|nr:lysylphosphatidylglycerol synthase domain-containing protein [Nocardioides sp.]MDI6909577.1 lysylphosphatidylglycerol synthase domain-containing protein [Nocardioides sp.]
MSPVMSPVMSPAMSLAMKWGRVAAGAAVLAVVVERVGTGPFLDAVRATSPAALLAALAITALTTLCCAWRWRVVAARLGVDVPLRPAVGAYYRSQFLNATLPGGVLGDVHRAVRHGPMPVALERVVGQVVQVVATGGVLLAVSPWPAAAVAVGAGLAVALVRWPQVVAASVLAAAGHVVVFLVAARAAGTDATLAELLPLALVVLLAAAIPLNVAGWGPREGAAAWAFASAGLGAAEGATVAVVYGVLALVATLPGAVLLATGVLARGRLTERQRQLAQGVPARA